MKRLSKYHKVSRDCFDVQRCRALKNRLCRKLQLSDRHCKFSTEIIDNPNFKFAFKVPKIVGLA